MSSRRFGSQSLVRLLGHWQQTSSRTPLWRQLADALRLLILDGRLALHTRLPGERELATALNVSRTTVSSALAHLREEGYLESRHGSGSRVILPDARAVPPFPQRASPWIFPLPPSAPGRRSTRLTPMHLRLLLNTSR